jgi:hypothetical protein
MSLRPSCRPSSHTQVHDRPIPLFRLEWDLTVATRLFLRPAGTAATVPLICWARIVVRASMHNYSSTSLVNIQKKEHKTLLSWAGNLTAFLCLPAWSAKSHRYINQLWIIVIPVVSVEDIWGILKPAKATLSSTLASLYNSCRGSHVKTRSSMYGAKAIWNKTLLMVRSFLPVRIGLLS